MSGLHRFRRIRMFLRLALLGALLGAPIAGRAHVFEISQAEAHLPEAGRYRIDMQVDVDALALGVSPLADSSELAERLAGLPEHELKERMEHARRTLLRRVRIRFDGQAAEPAIDFPGRGDPDPQAPPSFLGLTARFEGDLPAGAKTFTFQASRAFPPIFLTARSSLGPAVEYLLRRGEESPPLEIANLRPAGAVAVVAAYVRLGFEHILPAGLDHVLFVLGLYLLSSRLRPLLWQITAFTAAHTLTLALSIFGLVSLPSRLVETLIALSIAYVAIENIFTTELKPWRTALVFGFGLLHGLGFAGVLVELGLPAGKTLLALASFNVGVEFGQLAVVLLAMAAIGWLRTRPGARRWLVVPASLAIASVGLYWAFERALG